MSECLDENLVLALLDGQLEDSEMTEAERHLDVCPTCHELVAAAADALDPSAARPEVTMGRYRLVAPLGYGASAIVYRARDLETGDWVALKAVQMGAPGMLASIRREIHVLGRLQHPGIVRIIDHGVDAGRPWYAMELLEGETLAAFQHRLWESAGVERSRASAGELPLVLAVARQLCETLAFLHGEGVIHRDLKPSNIVLRPDGQPVLVDFGLTGFAQAGLGREIVTITRAAGTPAYVAPEQIAGSVVDGRADLYALGCVLYELIAGRPPFVGGSAGEVLLQHLHTAAPPLGRNIGGVSPRLEELVGALLAKSPRERPGHADDVAAALEAAGAPRPHGQLPARRPNVYRPSLIGRTGELAELVARAASARQGRGGMALVFGASGIGKTYLATEAARRVDGMLVIEGTCAPLETPVDHQTTVLAPFRGFLDAVADRCQVLGRTASDRIVGPRGKVLARLLPRLAELPGQEAWPPPREEGGAAAREQLLAALRETLTALAAEEPMVLLLDDLHWADDLTLRFLATLSAEYFAGTSLLIVGTCRVEECPPAVAELRDRPFVRSITLGRLEEAAVRSLVVDMLAWDAPPERWVSTLSEQSEGNPFFIAELVRTAVSDRIVRRQDGRWVAEVPLQAPRLPTTLRDLMRRRLGALAIPARALVEVAAVLGRDLDAELLEATARLDDAATMDDIAELVRSQVLEEPAPGRLRFVHGALHAVAYDDVPASQKRALHHAAAEAIERRHGVAAAAQLAPLAHHWAAAGVPTRASHYLSLAGDSALGVGAYAQAAKMFARALELDEDERVLDPEQLAHRQLGLGQAHFGLGDLDALEVRALDALAALGRRPPSSRGAWRWLLGQQAAVQLGHLLFGARSAREPERPALRESALAAGLLSQRYFYLEDPLRMAASVLLSINSAERCGAEAPVARAYTAMGGLAGLLRLPRLAARYFASAHAAAAENISERAMSVAVEVVMEASLGRWRRARVAVARLEAWLPEVSDPLIRENVITTLCLVEFISGSLGAARARTDDLVAAVRASGNTQHVMWSFYFTALAASYERRWADALPPLAEARRALRTHPETLSEINCLGLEALSSLRVGRPDEARTLADAALERILRSRPTGFASLIGYGEVAEVYRELAAERPPGSPEGFELARRWGTMRGAIRRFAVAFPVARPLALLETGHAARAAGRRRVAEVCFRLSSRVARRFSMPGATADAEAALRMI